MRRLRFQTSWRGFRARIKNQVGQREKSGQNDASAGLSKRDDPANEIDDAHRAFERAASDADLDPDKMPHGIGRGFPITDRHGEEDATEQRNDVGDSNWQISEAKRELHVPRQNQKQGAEKEENRRVKREENANGAKIHSGPSLTRPLAGKR
jgi:hypothetical protein